MGSVSSPSETSYILLPDNHHTPPQQTAQILVSGTSATNESASDQSQSSPLNDAQSNAQAVPEPPRANPRPETLTLALPSVEDGEKDRYAVVSFPVTYKVRFSSSVHPLVSLVL